MKRRMRPSSVLALAVAVGVAAAGPGAARAAQQELAAEPAPLASRFEALREEPLARFLAGWPGTNVAPASSVSPSRSLQSSQPRSPSAAWWWGIGIGAAGGGYVGLALASHCHNEGGARRGGSCSAAVPVFAGLGALAGFLVAAR